MLTRRQKKHALLVNFELYLKEASKDRLLKEKQKKIREASNLSIYHTVGATLRSAPGISTIVSLIS